MTEAKSGGHETICCEYCAEKEENGIEFKQIRPHVDKIYSKGLTCFALLEGQARKTDRSRFLLRQLLLRVHGATERHETLINLANYPALSLFLKPAAYATSLNRFSKALENGDLAKALHIGRDELNIPALEQAFIEKEIR